MLTELERVVLGMAAMAAAISKDAPVGFSREDVTELSQIATRLEGWTQANQHLMKQPTGPVIMGALRKLTEHIGVEEPTA